MNEKTFVSSYRFKEETYTLQKYIYAARNELKAGWSEHIYHQILTRMLREDGIPVRSKPRQSLTHRGKQIHLFEPDLIVWDKIILELKVLPYRSSFTGEHYAQLIHYLKFFSSGLGLLVNFAPSRVITRRVLWDEPALDIFEDDRRSQSHSGKNDIGLLHGVRDAIQFIARQYGLGYSDAIYRGLVFVELTHLGITCRENIEVPARWQNEIVAHYRTPFLLVGDAYLVHICALSHRPHSYEFKRMKTYLGSLGLEFGLIVNFAHKQLQMYEVSTL